MQFNKIPIIVVSIFLFFPLSAWVQEHIDRELEIHKNVKLVVLAPTPDISEDMAKQYQSFLSILEEALKVDTTDQSDECFITIRVKAGIKEIGSAKVKRPTAVFTAFRRNSRQEYQGTLILYSYATAGPVNQEETSQFLKKQILDPAECQKAE